MSTIQETEAKWSEDGEVLDNSDRILFSLGMIFFALVALPCFLGALINNSPYLGVISGILALASGYCAFSTAMDGLTRIRLLRDELQASYRREHILEVEVGFLRPQVDHGRHDSPR